MPIVYMNILIANHSRRTHKGYQEFPVNSLGRIWMLGEMSFGGISNRTKGKEQPSIRLSDAGRSWHIDGRHTAWYGPALGLVV